MPTGVHLQDARTRLFDAAEVVLRRDGPDALTSRAITAEAGCAKGVLHRHFSDVDTFLAELVVDRAARIEARGAELVGAAGTGTVVANLTEALTAVFSSVALAVIPLITFRDALRARLRDELPGGVPILGQATTAVAAYLAAERERGRIAAGTDADAVALALIGGAHLALAGGADVDAGAVERVVRSVVLELRLT